MFSKSPGEADSRLLPVVFFLAAAVLLALTAGCRDNSSAAQAVSGSGSVLTETESAGTSKAAETQAPADSESVAEETASAAVLSDRAGEYPSKDPADIPADEDLQDAVEEDLSAGDSALSESESTAGDAGTSIAVQEKRAESGSKQVKTEYRDIPSPAEIMADISQGKPLIINFRINVENLEPEPVTPEPEEESVASKPAEITETPDTVRIENTEPEASSAALEETEEEDTSRTARVFEDIVNPEDSPLVSIVSPGDRTFYSRKIQIEGKVSNSEAESSSVDRIKSVLWEIPGKKEPEELFFGSDGVFFLSFSSNDYSGVIELLFTAENGEGVKSRKRLVLFDGNIKPDLSLESPENQSLYGAAIRISGSVLDSSAMDMGASGPAFLEYSLFPVDGTGGESQISGEIPVKSDGSFSGVIRSAALSGKQLVTVTVRGRNGRVNEKTVTILEADSDIPGFKVSLDEGKIRLEWGQLPGVNSYNLYYSEGKTDPVSSSGHKFENVDSPVVISNLSSGELYGFKLEAVEEKENDQAESFWSDVKEIIYLDTDTLSPVVTPGYQQINLVWADIPGAVSYDVLRSVSSSGELKVIAHGIGQSSFTDRDVVFGKTYYYSIRPSLAGSLASAPVSAESLPFPEEKTEVLADFRAMDLQDIKVVGSYVFLAGGPDGMRIIDNADPVNPVEVSNFESEDAKGIVIRGERCYLADGYRGLKIISLNDPRNPELLGSRKTIDATKLALVNNFAYIADGDSGIKIIDISDEREPERVASIKTEHAVDLAVSNGYLYVADGPGGVKIYSLAKTPDIDQAGVFKCRNAIAAVVSGKTAYIGDKGYGIRILNLSEPSMPVEIGRIEMENITDLIVRDNYVFASDSAEGLFIYEISDPHRPVLFDEVVIEGAKALTMEEGIIYLAYNEGFKAVKSFTVGRSFVIAEYKTDGKAYDLAYIDDSLYLADHQNGVKIVDVPEPSDSNSFSVREEIPTTYAESIIGMGSRLLIADGKGGVVVGQVTKTDDGTSRIEVVDKVELPGITKSLALQGNKAYIAAREEGMHVLNMDTREISTVYTGGSVQEIYAEEGFVYVADGPGGLKIYSLDPDGLPVFVSSVNLPNISTVSAEGHYIVAGGRDGVTVVDVSNPESPGIVSSYFAGWVEDVYLTSGYIYAAAGYEGLIILDMKKPDELVLVSKCEDIYAVGVDVEKDLAFVADVDGFKVVKVLIPSWLK